METEDFNAGNTLGQIADNKGTTGPFAQKAADNIQLIMKSGVHPERNVHYFAVGHTFRQIDAKNIFVFKLDEERKEMAPTAFMSMQNFDLSFCEELKVLVGNIRNLNSHYVHDFSKIKTKSISCKILDFLRESFQLALMQSYMKEKDISYEKYSALPDKEKKLVYFLKDKFYPFDTKRTKDGKTEKYLEQRKRFGNLSLHDAIESLLFVKVKAEYDWNLLGKYFAFKVAEGSYLSFFACMFLVTMFLYRNEAEKFVSMIKGFKNNKSPEEKSKREIFTFFSKKFSSQDTNNEEKFLIKFRDIIQYLNRFPTKWSGEFTKSPEHPVMLSRLNSKIVEMEIFSSFEQYAGDKRFLAYAENFLLGKSHPEMFFTEKEETEYKKEINTSPELKGLYKKLSDIKGRKDKHNVNKDLARVKQKIDEISNVSNHVIDEIRESLQNIPASWGRNQDRFMLFAARFLVETNYFGKDARFKVFCNKSMEEERADRKEKRKTLSKKEYDSQKYRHGRRVEYKTYDEHLKAYPEWDDPFVVENNAIQVRI